MDEPEKKPEPTAWSRLDGKGTILLAIVVVVSAVYLEAKRIALPGWLAALVILVAAFMRPPSAKDGAQ